MRNDAAETSILLVDDGELDAVAALLESLGAAYLRLRGSEIPAHVSPPEDLLIVTPRRVERVRRGSPPDAAPGSPLRIVAVEDDSPAIRRRLRQTGLHLLVRLPTATEIWRLLIDRALYKGEERRQDTRVTVGSLVELTRSDKERDPDSSRTTLIDLSNRGCRLHTTEVLRIDDVLAFAIPMGRDEDAGNQEPLILRGRVRRMVEEIESPGRTVAMTFDENLPDAIRTRLTSVINRWASGPGSLSTADDLDVPAIPPCLLPSLPDLTLDDETDPPVRSASEVHLRLATPNASARTPAADTERRHTQRGQFESTVMAESAKGRIVLIGRDLSPLGLRVERTEHLQMADRFRLALYGPASCETMIVDAEVIRDDGDEGFALAFRGLGPENEREIGKWVACLPELESLEHAEGQGIGAILSELIRD